MGHLAAEGVVQRVNHLLVLFILVYVCDIALDYGSFILVFVWHAWGF